VENNLDECAYLKIANGSFIIMVLYVDDILLATNDLGLIMRSNNFYIGNLIRKILVTPLLFVG